MTADRFFIRPLYMQLHDELAKRIAAGEWKVGTALPSEQHLARELSVSAGTLRKSLDILERDHLIVRRRGKGTFVNNPTAPAELSRFTNLRTGNGDPVLGELASVDIVRRAATKSEKALLLLQSESDICALRRLRLFQGIPLLVEDVFLPSGLFSDVTDAEWRTSWLTDIALKHGVLLGSATEKVTATAASAETAKALCIPQGSAIFVLERLITTLDGRPAQWRRAECASRGLFYEVVAA